MIQGKMVLIATTSRSLRYRVTDFDGNESVIDLARDGVRGHTLKSISFDEFQHFEEVCRQTSEAIKKLAEAMPTCDHRQYHPTGRGFAKCNRCGYKFRLEGVR